MKRAADTYDAYNVLAVVRQQKRRTPTRVLLPSGHLTVEWLPLSVLAHALSFLDVNDLLVCYRVTTLFRSACEIVCSACSKSLIVPSFLANLHPMFFPTEDIYSSLPGFSWCSVLMALSTKQYSSINLHGPLIVTNVCPGSVTLQITVRFCVTTINQ